VLEQGLEHQQLAPRQREARLAHVGLARVVVEAQLPERHDEAGAHRGAPRQRAHARHELVHREGLGEVVVGAAVQAQHALGHVGHGGEHQHRGGDVVLPQERHEREAVAVGQAAVEHDHVVLRAERRLLGLAQRARHIDHRLVLPQRRGERLRQIDFVFDKQDSHEGWRCGGGGASGWAGHSRRAPAGKAQCSRNAVA
jgi:hypothetical protein